MYLRLLLILPLVSFHASCGKSSSTAKNSVTKIDFTTQGVLQFKSSASSFGVSGTRYDLDFSEGKITKYNFSSDTSRYEEVESKTLSSSTKTALSSKLKSVSHQSYGTCSDCTETRASVWIEITDRSEPAYYFANEGDCTCPADGENAPTLPYTTMKTIYDSILALF